MVILNVINLYADMCELLCCVLLFAGAVATVAPVAGTTPSKWQYKTVPVCPCIQYAQHILLAYCKYVYPLAVCSNPYAWIIFFRIQ